MTGWREFDPALTQVLVELPDEAVLVVSGRGRLVQFLRGGDRMAVEVSNDSPGDEPRLRDRQWRLADEWAGLWRRDFPRPAGQREAAVIVAETGHVLRNVWGWTGLDGFRYESWVEITRKMFGFFPRSEERRIRWPGLGLPERLHPDRMDE